MIALPAFVKEFMAIFRKNGFQIYVVGGAVRDLLLGRKKQNGINWDFTTDATPEQILRLFPDGFYNNKFGTVGVSKETKEGKLLFEVTTFRKESGYSDKRHPDKIQWAGTIEEDLGRRDFTINAMALRLVPLAQGKRSYEIIDPYGGKKHLKQKLIAAVGNPDERFTEDALRLMRGIRFASELGFLIEDKTRASIQKKASFIVRISWERIRDELLKIMQSDHPAEGILFMKNSGLLVQILPEVDICFMIPQKSPQRHHIYDVGTHLVMSLKFCPSKDPITRLATLMHDIGKAKTFRKDKNSGLITFYNHEVVGTKMVTNIAERLKLSNEQKEKLIRLVQYHQFTVSELQTDKAVRRFIRALGRQYLQDMLDLRTGDRIGSGATPTSWRLELFKKRLAEVQKEPFTVSDLKVDGYDIMNILKLKPGKRIGEILKNLFDKVVDKQLENDRNNLLEEIDKLRN